MTLLSSRLWISLSLASTLWVTGCGGEPDDDTTSPTDTTIPGNTPTATPGSLTPTVTPGTLTPTITPTEPPGSPSPTLSPTPTGTPNGTATPSSTPEVDLDGDGFTASEGDCNDQDASINPDAAEISDGKDNNCNGQTDELASELDDDGDGFSEAQGDCNDTDPDIYPGATEEPYDGIDQDCLEGDLTDVDEDGFNGIEVVSGETLDCTDTDDTIYPGATETCNGKDDNCDGSIDEGLQLTVYLDADSDGYGSSTSLKSCSVPTGYVTVSGDCNDSEQNINPAATETCNGKDDNCNSSTDEGVSQTYYQDLDGDGFGSTVTSSGCTVPAGYVTKSGDCNDADKTISPNATEVCNSKDDDCDGKTDDADTSITGQSTWYQDNDKDGYGNSTSTKACTQPAGYVATSGDCNDADNKISPAGVESCNGKDDDCDTLIDDADSSVTDRKTWYRDADGDGYGNSAVSTVACSAPTGYVATSGDFNDGSKSIYPGATELCNGIDDNCNGTKDEGVSSTTYYADADGDGFGNKNVSTTTCNPPAGYVTSNTDCDDTSNTIYPGATETCNGKDDDCDLTSDEEGAANSCSGEDTECAVRTCVGGKCAQAFTASGTPVSTQTQGDCKNNVCDGTGGTTTLNVDSDIPPSTNACSVGSCSAGTPSQSTAAAGTTCSSNGGAACNSTGVCLPIFAALRVGTGSGSLSNAATAGFLEYRLTDGTLMPYTVNPLPLPTAAVGDDQPLTFSGSATSEGGLTRSADGRYLVVGGYATAPGTASVAGTTAATVNRVVARIDASRSINSKTRLNNAYDKSNIRSAFTVDGTGFWTAGTSSPNTSMGEVPSGGVQYVALAGTSATQVLATPDNTRYAYVYGNQLYASSASGTSRGVTAVGTGTPTTSGQTGTLLPGFDPAATLGSIYAFAMFDLDPAVPGVDTLYAADDTTVSTVGGLIKYSFDGTTWTKKTTFITGLSAGLRGLAAKQMPDGILIVATTADSTSSTSGNKIVTLLDNGISTPSFKIITTAPGNTAYRGVAFAP
ncbi:MAG: putative metal-binding motif-containing protein [Myxococcota bacterium]